MDELKLLEISLLFACSSLVVKFNAFFSHNDTSVLEGYQTEY